MITTSQRRRIVELSEQGMTTPELCARFGASRFAIRRILREHGLKAHRAERRPSPINPGLLKVIAEILVRFEEGCAEPHTPLGSEIVAVSRGMRREHHPWQLLDPDGWMLWRRLAFQTGDDEMFRPYPWSRIADDLGVSTDAVERAAGRIQRALWQLPRASLIEWLAFPPEKAALQHESSDGERWQIIGAAGRSVEWERPFLAELLGRY